MTVQMKGAFKEFDPEAYQQWGGPARAAVAAFLEKKNMIVANNREDGGVDIVAVTTNPTRTLFIEVEVRPACWEVVGGGRRMWRYPALHVLERKAKLLQNVDPASFWLFALSDNMRDAMVADGASILASPQKEVPNSQVPEGELFFDVPIDLCEYRDLQGQWATAPEPSSTTASSHH